MNYFDILLAKKLSGGGGSPIDLKEITITENGTVVAPSGEAYNKIITNVPLPQNAYLLKSVTTPTPIASFNDGEEMVMPTLKVAIEPQQDLHGYDSPWVGGAGKNKYSGGNVTVNNTLFASVDVSPIPSGTYTISALLSNETTNDVRVAFRKADGSAINATELTYNASGRSTGTITTDAVTEKIYFYYGNSTSGIGTRTYTKIQIEQGTTATSYAPYSNICPISGWSDVNVTVADATTDPTVENVYTIDLDGTRYGGELDVVNGIVTPAPYYASYNGETLTGEWISDRDKYEVGATPTIGAQVVNIGASGTPVSILPTAVKSLRGVNNVWANTGDIKDAEYFSKETE